MSNKENNVHVINLNSYEPPVIVESKKDDFVFFGEDNLYFDYLIERYIQSPTNHAVINNIVKLIYGKGLMASDASKRPEQYAQMKMLFSKDCTRRLTSDLKMLGQCAIQVLYNKDRSKIVETNHVPIQLLRAEKCNIETGEIEAYYFSNDWSDLRNHEPQRISAFGMSKDDTEILYIRPYSVNMRYYSYPDWQGVVSYSQLETEISHFLVNDTQNGFSGTRIVNLNSGVPDIEKREEIKHEILQKLSGARGQKTIVSFNHDSTNQTDIQDISLNNAPSHYEYLSDECMHKILTGHGVVNSAIFGIATASGFSSASDELMTSFQLYMNMTVRPFQDLLIDGLQKILTYNEVNLNLYFETLNPFDKYDANGNVIVEEEEKQELKKETPEIDLSMYGEKPNKEWILIDEFDADIEKENEYDQEIELAQKKANEDKPEKLSMYQRLRKAMLVSTGNPQPAEVSEQDWIINGMYFITRYKYVETDYFKKPSKGGESRPFCKAMMRQNDNVYRKEDLDAMSKNPSINPGFGPNGSNTYDIMAYKGGPNCKHLFRRQVWVGVDFGVPLDPTSQLANQISVYRARKYGYRVKGNPSETAVAPINQPNQGYLK
jgi:hypothetical protein